VNVDVNVWFDADDEVVVADSALDMAALHFGDGATIFPRAAPGTRSRQTDLEKLELLGHRILAAVAVARGQEPPVVWEPDSGEPIPEWLKNTL
jgi:hypothetical protein